MKRRRTPCEPNGCLDGSIRFRPLRFFVWILLLLLFDSTCQAFLLSTASKEFIVVSQRTRSDDAFPSGTTSSRQRSSSLLDSSKQQGRQKGNHQDMSKSSNSSPRRRRQKKNTTNSATIQFHQELQSIIHGCCSNRHGGISVAQQAETRLLQQLQHDSNSNNTTMVVDTISFNLVLQAWARQHSWKAAQRADQLLRLLLLQSGLFKADSFSYGAVIHAYAKSGSIKAAQRAQELLQQMLSSRTIVVSTDICHNAVMDAWAVSGDARAGERAEQLLQQLEHSSIQPTRISYNACIKAYGKAGQAEQAQRVLDKMRILSIKQPQFKPDKVSLSTCIDAWAKSSHPQAFEQAERLLCEMEQQSHDVRMRPDIVAYSSVLCCAATKSSTQSSIAMNLLQRMQRYGREKPNAAFLNTWIHLLSKSSSNKGNDVAAERILAYMKTQYRNDGQERLRPCKVTYTSVISVLAQVGNEQAAEKAQVLLDELENLYNDTKDPAFLPSARTFASVLNAWAKSGSSSKAFAQSDALLERMDQLYQQTQAEDLRPNLVVFAQVFQILSKCRDHLAPTRAKELLQRMNALHQAGYPNVRPDATTMAYFLNTLTKSGVVENAAELATHVLQEVEEGYKAGMGHLKPTGLLYSAALQAYAKSASREGAELAEALLERTKELYRQGKLYAKPTVLFYNAVMDALARSDGGKEAAERAESLLEEMDRRSLAGDSTLKPRTRSFNAAILAWKNSNSADAPHRAEALLKRMNDRYRDGDEQCRPDRVTLNSIIGVWAKSSEEGAAERAEKFLKWMEVAYKNGDLSFKPCAYSYNSVIDAFSKHDDAIRATRLFERMKKIYEAGDKDLRPDVITFTSLKSAWAKSTDAEAPQQLRRIMNLIAQCEHTKRAADDKTGAANSVIETVGHNITIATS